VPQGQIDVERNRQQIIVAPQGYLDLAKEKKKNCVNSLCFSFINGLFLSKSPKQGEIENKIPRPRANVKWQF
jgi:hypothetical protein